ncbi:NB-ARC domain-containing protein [Pantanalinema rosaneae CENA516]|uniref:WD40 repeat domain-containing protein n=1 Tax=Pantanalinema rosaneae TaxID=1620701 RepID=UPI003D6FBF59
MTVEDAIALIRQHLERGQLTKVQEIVLREAWVGKTYLEIARVSGYDPGYIKDTGAELWKLLSKIFGEKVTKHNLHGVLARASQSPTPLKTPISPAQSRDPVVDWGEAIDISHFCGRTAELNTLQQWIVADRCRVITLVGMGGMGKTALSVKLAEQLHSEFEYIFWRSLRHAPLFKDKLTECIKFLSHHQIVTLPESVHEQITCLIEYLRKSRCLLILDNFDTLLQQGQAGDLYRDGYAAYGELLWRLGETQHQSCVLITSREKPSEIATLEGKALPIRTLPLPGLEIEAGQRLLTMKGLSGSSDEIHQLVEAYRGNPLALKIAATSIQDLYHGSVAQFFAEGTTVFNGISRLLQQHFQRLSGLEQQVMYWLAIHRETVSVNTLQAAFVPTVSKTKLINALERLTIRSLVECRFAQFTQQPVVMEYVIGHLIEQIEQEIVTEIPQTLLTHALMQAQSKDYIRDSQICLIVQPLLEQLRSHLGSDQQVQHKLHQFINQLRTKFRHHIGYGCGNLLNLLAHLNSNLSGYDFSYLNIRQADLRSLNLHQVNFTEANFQECAFAATFGGITCTTFSPDGESLATSDTNGMIYLWRTTDGQPQVICKGHNSWIWSVAFSPLGSILASGGQDHTVRLWDSKTGECLNTFPEHTGIVTAIAFSPDGQTLASTGYDRTIKLWHLATGLCIQTLTGQDACIWSIAFHPDGEWLASAGEDNIIRLWHWQTGTCVQTLAGHHHWIKAIAFSPDGQQLASGSFDQTIKVWDVATGVCLSTLIGHTSVVTALAFSPTGDRIASSSYDQTVKLWEATTGRCLDTLEKHTNRVWSVAFHPQGHRLVSGGDDYAARIWELQTGQCIKTLQGHSNCIYAIAHDAHHHLLASGHEDQTIKLWNMNLQTPEQLTASLQPFQVLRGHRDRVLAVDLSPNSQVLASGSADRTIKLWNPHTGQCLNTLQGHRSWVWTVRFSPDSQLLASGSYDHTIKLWQVNSGACWQTLEGHPSSVLGVTFSHDGSRLVSGGYDQMIKLWQVETGQCLHTWQAHSNRVWAVAISPDDRLLATGGDDQTIKIWNLATGDCLQTLTGHTNQVLCLRFTANGQQVISSSADRSIRTWDIQTGECLTTLADHQHWVWSLNLSLNAQTLLSSSQDETIKCWNLTTGKCQQTFRVLRPYEGMIITGVTGLTEAEATTLRALGAIADSH